MKKLPLATIWQQRAIEKKPKPEASNGFFEVSCCLRTETKRFNNDLIVSKTRKKALNVVYRWKCRSNRIISAKLFSK
ncbi:unnamed protein product [Cuscuta campestris]|uniref:Uncharacterized protein n=1 Tax=Cuscuta campestris TaxID=132261 RepID=A0A484LCB9_9ASTE|nr:unnamed protein product [Cuscuta campestris]